MAEPAITVVAAHIPMFTFEVRKRPNEHGYAQAFQRATKLANIILGENQYNAYFNENPNRGTSTNV